MTPALDARNRFRGTHPCRRTSVGGNRWEYYAAGRGQTGVLVLGDAIAFGDTAHRLVTRFGESRKVLSPSYPHVASAGELVEGLVGLLNLEGLEDVDVVGIGLGAGLAHLLVRRYPERVSRLALAGFGLTTPFRVAANRALTEMFELLPSGARQHYERLYQRHAEAAGDAARATELLSLTGDLLDRHSRESLLQRFRLQNDLFRGQDEYRLERPVAARALVLLASDDPCFTRQEQDNLARTYPGGLVSRSANAGRLLGLTPAPEAEKKLDLFFRIEPVRTFVAAGPARASA